MTVAWIVLLSWPFVAMAFYRTMSFPAALTATIVGGYLFLPEQVEYKIPGLPAIGKESIPVLAALLIVAIARPEVAGPKGFFLPRSRWAATLLGVFFLGGILTFLTNTDPLFHARRWLPGLPPSDIPVMLLEFFVFLLPFFLARRYLATESAQMSMLKVLVFFGMLYSLAALFEIRMSPQLNNWVYGFFPHSFAQHIRNGGFRPIVFLNHGLWLSSFLMMATLAAVGLMRTVPKEQKTIYLVSAVWLFGTLFLTKSLGAFVVATILIAMWSLLPRRALTMGLAGFVILVLTYPLLRTLDVIPVDWVVETVARFSTDRAGSFGFRIFNEDALLDHARERPIFGWGLFGRYLAAPELIKAVPDGYWVISFGAGGYTRYFSEFGLLTVGALALLFGRRQPGPAALAMTVVLTANLIDLLPNATLTTLTWLWAGALAGRMEMRDTDEAQVARAQTAAEPRRTRYARANAQEAPYRREFTDRRLKR